MFSTREHSNGFTELEGKTSIWLFWLYTSHNQWIENEVTLLTRVVDTNYQERMGCCYISHIERTTSGARSRWEALHSWQRSWGRRLGIRKGGIKPRESPWIFSSIYPLKKKQKNTRVCLLYCFVLSPLTLPGAVPHHHLALSDKELKLSPTTILLSLTKS